MSKFELKNAIARLDAEIKRREGLVDKYKKRKAELREILSSYSPKLKDVKEDLEATLEFCISGIPRNKEEIARLKQEKTALQIGISILKENSTSQRASK